MAHPSKINFALISLTICALLLCTIFIFLPHYVELTGVIESWFSYKGLIYYKDFVTYHLPLGRWILIPLHFLTNWDLRIDPFLALILGLAQLWIIYKFPDKYLSLFAKLLCLIFFTIYYWFFATGIIFYHEILVGFFLLIAIYFMTKEILDSKTNPKRTIVVGLALSLSIISGQIGALTALLSLGIYLYILFRKKPKIKILFTFLFISFSIPFFFLIFYFYLNNALYDFYYWNFLYYFEYAKYPKDSLTLLPIRTLLIYHLPLFFLSVLVCYSLLLKKKVSPLTFVIFILAISNIPFVIFGIFHFHHLSFGLPIFALLTGLTYDFANEFFKKRNAYIFGILLVSSSLILTNITPWYLERINTQSSLQIKNDLDLTQNEPMSNSVKWIKENTSKDTKIQVTGDSLFYLKADRVLANKYAKGVPTYLWRPFNRVKNELSENLPEYWILDQNFLKRLASEDQWNSPDMADFITTELKNCYSLKKQFSDWKIFKKHCD